MRTKKQQISLSNDYKLLIVDDDAGLIDSISSFLKRYGYNIRGAIDPIQGLENLKNEKYDLLILDYFMSPIKGDDFVSRLREFDRDLYVILLTGHKDMAPPFATIKAFDIQAYCEKSHKLDQLLLLIESGVKSINQRMKISNYRDGLNNILTALPEIYNLDTPDKILDAVLDQITSFTNFEDLFMCIDLEGTDTRSLCSGRGKFDTSKECISEIMGPEFKEKAEIAKTTSTSQTTDGGVIFPIVCGSNLYEGIVYVDGLLEDDERRILEVFIVNIAALIHNVSLHDELSHAYSDLKSSFVETIEALRLAVDARDVYTRGHSDRVAKLSEIIGKKIGFDKDALEELRIAGLFHDIGKIGVSDDILVKDTTLTEEEFAEIREHPTKGALILSAISAFESIKFIVCSHHEHMDGMGYPNGLKGDEIPLSARIINVTDAYDAMAYDRHYRKKLSKSDAIEQLLEGRDTQFDRAIVDCFIKLIEENTKEIAAIFD